jgi:hypothetical protein
MMESKWMQHIHLAGCDKVCQPKKTVVYLSGLCSVSGFLVEQSEPNEKRGDEPIKMLVAPCPHEERFAYAVYRTIERYFLQAAPSLPTQGFDVVDTCVVSGVVVLCISACFFESIWIA